MATIVSNLSLQTISVDDVTLDPNTSASVDVVTSGMLALYTSGDIGLNPAPSTRVPALIVDNSGGTPAPVATLLGTISTTTLTVIQGITTMAALVVNAAFTGSLVNVPVTFTGGTVPTGGAQATGLMSTNSGGTTATITIVTPGDYTAAPTGVTGTGLGSGSWTTFTPTLANVKGTGTIAIGQTLSGTGVTAGTYITAGSGVSWTVSASQTVSTMRLMTASAGIAAIAAGETYAQADVVAIKNALASAVAQLNASSKAIDYLTTAVAKLATDPDVNVRS